jgi:hypothetical protein
MAYKKILFRRDTAANWLSTNPTLSAGEIGLESDTGKIKLGDGSLDWDSLDYFYGSLEGADYVESLIAGTGLTITGNSGSGSTPTISIPQSVATSASPSFAQVLVSNLPSADSHVATKAYVDGIASSINWHDFVVFATAAVLPGTPTYNNGTSGVGATLTATSNARLIVDGQNASTGNRILVKTQADATQNGIYDVTVQGSVSTPYVLTRATDFDSGSTYGNINAGDAMYVGAGNTNSSQGFLVTSFGTGTNRAHIVGTDDITFTQFSGTATVTAGTGITKTGNTLSIGQSVATSASVSFAAVIGNLVGVASQATALQTGRLIGQTIFDGTSDISIGTSDITGLTVTASDLNKLFNVATTTQQFDMLNTASANVQVQLNSKASTETTDNIVTSLTEKADLLNPTFYQNISAGSNVYANEFHGNVVGYISEIGNHVLDDLFDVSVASPGDGYVLAWNSSASAWIAEETSIGSFNLADLSDVSASASSGQYLKYNGTAWSGDFVELGSETSGNYVASINAGTGVVLTNAVAGEGGTPTVAIGQAVGATDSPAFAGLSIGAQNLTVNGNLTYSSGTGLATLNTLTPHGLIVGSRITVSGANQAGYNGDFGVTQVASANQIKYTPVITPSSATSSGSVSAFAAGAIILEGSIDDIYETQVTLINPTADRVVALPDATTILVGQDTTDTLTNKTLTSPVITGVSPTLFLSGDLSGSATFTDLGNATLSATIEPNSVVMGTDTTGNYVSNLVAGTGVTITDNSGESATPTIAIGQAVGTSACVQFDTLVVQNLFATNTEVTNQASLNVASGEIVLNAGTVGAPTLDGSIKIDRGSSASVEIRWNETLDRWESTRDGSVYKIIDQGSKMTLGTTPPEDPDAGDFWFETDSAITFVYYDSYWIEIGSSGIGAVISSTAPSNASAGQIWFRNTTGETFVYYDGAWEPIGGSSGSGSNEIASIMGAY